jgi:hypothetical protein
MIRHPKCLARDPKEDFGPELDHARLEPSTRTWAGRFHTLAHLDRLALALVAEPQKRHQHKGEGGEGRG